MFAILNCVDVYVDACVRNEAGQLMFMSMFGRDTATRELMARIQLASGQDSLRELTLQGYGPYKGQKHTVQVADAKELDKLTGRLPKGLYGELTHVWIFHPSIKGVDKGAKRAWIIEHGRALNQDMLKTRVWQTVCELADIPLLQHWREPVLRQIWDSMVFEMGKTNPDPNTGAAGVAPQFCKPLGPVQACQVRLADSFAEQVSKLIRAGILSLEPPAPMPALASVV
jgi:hypothetical protein